MAGNIIILDTIEKYNRLLGAETLHPLVSMTDLSKLESIRHCRKEFGIYCIYYKELQCGTIEYGRSKYDYQEGTLLFIAPGQIAGIDDAQRIPPQSWLTRRPSIPPRPASGHMDPRGSLHPRYK